MNSASEHALTAEQYQLLLFERLEKSVTEGFSGINDKFDKFEKTFEKRLEDVATTERLEAEVRRLDREDELIRNDFATQRDEQRLAVDKKITALRWVWGLIITITTVIVNIAAAYLLKPH